MNKFCNELTLNNINIGDEYFFNITISENDINTFAKLTGDYNPLHVSEEFAKKTIFNNKIVHGMFLGSFFSRIVGMYCPGKNCLYLSQSLNFKKPVFINDELSISGKIIYKNEVTKILKLVMAIKKKNIIVVSGIAVVKLI